MAVVGVGAAAYAPAKYGLVTELVPAQGLVAANGWIEVTTVCAVVLGTVLGGFLISPWVRGWGTAWLAGAPPLSLSLALLLTLYASAALLNLGIPDSGARYARQSMKLLPMLRSFADAQRRLWADADGALSMAVTTLFWGAASVLQFAVLRWGVDVLGLGLDRAAYLQGAVAVASGSNAGRVAQGADAVALGFGAGEMSQGLQAVAIGAYAGQTSQPANTIILNASGSAVNGVAAQTNSFYVAPIRTTANGTPLMYNSTTKEITYSTVLEFVGSKISTSDSSGLTVDVQTTFNTDVVVENEDGSRSLHPYGKLNELTNGYYYDPLVSDLKSLKSNYKKSIV